MMHKDHSLKSENNGAASESFPMMRQSHSMEPEDNDTRPESNRIMSEDNGTSSESYATRLRNFENRFPTSERTCASPSIYRNANKSEVFEQSGFRARWLPTGLKPAGHLVTLISHYW